MVYALKSIFLFNYPIWVCILAPFVQMSERSFFYGKIIKEIKAGMGLFYQSQNRQKNIQQALQKMS